jgi:hypothetical protein
MPEPPKDSQMTLFDDNYAQKLNAWNFRRLLAQKYDVVVTNPPYMGSKGMTAKMSEYVQKHFPDSKSDLFAVFIERCGQLLKPNGYQAMITQHAWMFLSSYEKLRGKLFEPPVGYADAPLCERGAMDIVNMAHLGARAFEEIGGEVVQTTAFVLKARKAKGYLGTYARLVDFGTQDEKEAAFLSGEHRHVASADNFAKIPGSPVAYWVCEGMLRAFEKKTARCYGKAQKGLDTCDVDRFVRFWHEVSTDRISVRWFPYSKGGEYRKWYGNNDCVVNWENNGEELRNFRDKAGKLKSRPQNIVDYFKPLITWSAISSSKPSMR